MSQTNPIPVPIPADAAEPDRRNNDDPTTEDEAYALAVDEAEAANDLEEAKEVQRRMGAREDF